MRILNLTFEDEDFQFLRDVKGSIKWKEFILKAAYCLDRKNNPKLNKKVLEDRKNDKKIK